MFPAAKDLWGELAQDEANHASILAIGSRYAHLEKLPDFIVPDSLTHMRETLGLVDRVKAAVQSKNISVDEALGVSLKLEQTLEQGHLPEVMTRKTNSEIVARLQRLLADTRSHIISIREYMERSGKLT